MDNATTSSIDAIARNCIAVRLRLLNRVVTNLYDDALRPLGLKVSQLNVLVVTAKLGLARPARSLTWSSTTPAITSTRSPARLWRRWRRKASVR